MTETCLQSIKENHFAQYQGGLYLLVRLTEIRLETLVRSIRCAARLRPMDFGCVKKYPRLSVSGHVRSAVQVERGIEIA